ncbi:MAG TPA: iron export ABC transporter permease subunit FetB, partial [Rhodospirillaceae bacterium]|nr:iron export ABC transporter permease subunit FetB [Rhodospirillaceae bacterium]
MTSQAIPLTAFDLALAAFLLVINGGLSLWLGLGITRSLVIAAVRMTVQLLLVGLVLKALFAQQSPWLTLGVVGIMVGFAGYEIMNRQDRKLTGWWSYGIGVSTMTFAAISVTCLALTTQLKPDPWWDARYAVPILGMILGNAMTGISLGLNTLFNTVVRERWAVEAQIALGFPRQVALRPFIRRALKTALMPTINSMAATGVVSLPGMMTGQILAGADPVEAVKYQLLVM